MRAREAGRVGQRRLGGGEGGKWGARVKVRRWRGEWRGTGGRVGMLVERGSRHRRRREAVTRPVSIDCEKAPFHECAKRLLFEGSQEGGEEGRTRARAHTHTGRRCSRRTGPSRPGCRCNLPLCVCVGARPNTPARQKHTHLHTRKRVCVRVRACARAQARTHARRTRVRGSARVRVRGYVHGCVGAPVGGACWRVRAGACACADTGAARYSDASATTRTAACACAWCACAVAGAHNRDGDGACAGDSAGTYLAS